MQEGVAGGEVPPPLRHGRERRGQIFRQHDGQVHDREVTQDAGEPASRPRAGRLAQRLRAQLGQRLLDMQAVPAAEQSEQVRRVIGRHRQAAGFRVGAGQDGRQGEARVPADGARVAEPGGAIGQRRKIGVQRAVNPAGTVEEGGERELIEDDDHHRWGGDEGDTVERPLPIGRRQEARNGRMEQEHRRHDHRCRGKERGEEADRREPDVANDGERAAGRRRRQRGHAAPVCKLPDGRERDGGDEPADDDHGCAPPPAGGEAPGQAECEEAADRAGQADNEHQRQQAARPGVVGDEELGATPQDVEDRLRDGEAPESGDVDRVEAALARGGPSGLLRVHVGQPLPIRHTVQMLSDAAVGLGARSRGRFPDR